MDFISKHTIDLLEKALTKQENVNIMFSPNITVIKQTEGSYRETKGKDISNEKDFITTSLYPLNSMDKVITSFISSIVNESNIIDVIKTLFCFSFKRKRINYRSFCILVKLLTNKSERNETTLLELLTVPFFIFDKKEMDKEEEINKDLLETDYSLFKSNYKESYKSYMEFNIKLLILHQFDLVNSEVIPKIGTIFKNFELMISSYSPISLAIFFLLYSSSNTDTNTHNLNKAKAKILFSIFDYDLKGYIESNNKYYQQYLRLLIYYSIFLPDYMLNSYINKLYNGKPIMDSIFTNFSYLFTLETFNLKDIIIYKKMLFFLSDFNYMKDFINYISHNLIFIDKTSLNKLRQDKFIKNIADTNYAIFSALKIRSLMYYYILNYYKKESELFFEEIPKLIIHFNNTSENVTDAGLINSINRKLIKQLNMEGKFLKYTNFINNPSYFSFFKNSHNFMLRTMNKKSLLKNKKIDNKTNQIFSRESVKESQQVSKPPRSTKYLLSPSPKKTVKMLQGVSRLIDKQKTFVNSKIIQTTPNVMASKTSFNSNVQFIPEPMNKKSTVFQFDKYEKYEKSKQTDYFNINTDDIQNDNSDKDSQNTPSATGNLRLKDMSFGFKQENSSVSSRNSVRNSHDLTNNSLNLTKLKSKSKTGDIIPSNHKTEPSFEKRPSQISSLFGFKRESNIKISKESIVSLSQYCKRNSVLLTNPPLSADTSRRHSVQSPPISKVLNFFPIESESELDGLGNKSSSNEASSSSSSKSKSISEEKKEQSQHIAKTEPSLLNTKLLLASKYANIESIAELDENLFVSGNLHNIKTRKSNKLLKFNVSKTHRVIEEESMNTSSPSITNTNNNNNILRTVKSRKSIRYNTAKSNFSTVKKKNDKSTANSNVESKRSNKRVSQITKSSILLKHIYSPQQKDNKHKLKAEYEKEDMIDSISDSIKDIPSEEEYAKLSSLHLDSNRHSSRQKLTYKSSVEICRNDNKITVSDKFRSTKKVQVSPNVKVKQKLSSKIDFTPRRTHTSVRTIKSSKSVKSIKSEHSSFDSEDVFLLNKLKVTNSLNGFFFNYDALLDSIDYDIKLQMQKIREVTKHKNERKVVNHHLVRKNEIIEILNNNFSDNLINNFLYMLDQLNSYKVDKGWKNVKIKFLSLGFFDRLSHKDFSYISDTMNFSYLFSKFSFLIIPLCITDTCGYRVIFCKLISDTRQIKVYDPKGALTQITISEIKDTFDLFMSYLIETKRVVEKYKFWNLSVMGIQVICKCPIIVSLFWLESLCLYDHDMIENNLNLNEEELTKDFFFKYSEFVLAAIK